MNPLLHRLNTNPHPFDPTTWPKAVVLIGCLLVLIWLSLGLRMLWGHSPKEPSPALARFETSYRAPTTDCGPIVDKQTNSHRPAIDTNSQTRIIPRP